MKRRIFIAGADGFIGKELVRGLRDEGFDISGSVFRRDAELGEVWLDVCAPDAATRLPKEQFDVVVNAMGTVDQSLPQSDLNKINAEGTSLLLDWSKKIGIEHFVQISSTSVYGLKTLGQMRSEDVTRRHDGPLAIPYMRSKARAERYVESRGVPYTILRLPAVYGAGDSFFSRPIVSHLRSGTLCFSGDGHKLVSLMYVKNLPAIIHRVIEAGPALDSFNTADVHVTWREIVAEYARALGIEFEPRRQSLATNLHQLWDRELAMLITFSRYGAHYPTDKLSRYFGELPGKLDWRDGVREAVESVLC